VADVLAVDARDARRLGHRGAHTLTGASTSRGRTCPLGYRLAAWPIATLPDAPLGSARDVPRAARRVRDAFPTTTSIALVRDRRTLDADDRVSHRARAHPRVRTA
jgi:hypothetical protein